MPPFFIIVKHLKKMVKKLWFKQDYTPDTNTKPWKRPYDWKLCKDKLYRDVLEQIHKLIDYQESELYIVPRMIKRPINTKLEIYLWGISDDKDYIMENCKYCLETAKKYNLKPNILGLNYDWKNIVQPKTTSSWALEVSRIYLIRDLIKDKDDDTIFLIMDGFDTLFQGAESEILENYYSTNTDLLISEIIHINENYYSTNTDLLISAEKAKNINHTFENKLDYYNKVFWVTTNDDDVLSNDSFYNPFTKSYPKILHVIGGRRENEQLYKEIYSKILNLFII